MESKFISVEHKTRIINSVHSRSLLGFRRSRVNELRVCPSPVSFKDTYIIGAN